VPDAAPGYFGWALFLLALGLSARLMRDAPRPTAALAEGHANFTIPVASAGLIGSLLLTSLVSRELWQIHVATLLPAMFLAIVLIVVRQTIIARENLRMALAMRKAKDIAESANNSRLHFLANISHDLRTPLNGVLGCAQILLRDRTVTPKQKDLLKTMHGCGEHLRNLISDLLDLSKLEADKLELSLAPCDARSFFDAINKTFSLEAENKNIALTLDADDSVPGWIKADRKRLQQILGNLVHNAIKFTDRGGVHLRVRGANGRLRCEVQDTGCGILPDKLPELFQPFHVVDDRSLKLEGTGLGLSIAKKLAQKMGGDITVESVISKGSTFTLQIPCEEAAPVVDVQRTVVDYQGRRRRILIVDDQPANRVVLRTMLEPLDFLIDEAGDASQALKQIDFARPDAILLDLMMPGVDGFELCQHIAQLGLNPPIPCIAVSAMSGVEVKERCAKTGFRELLNKPVNLDLLLETLGTHAGIEWTYGVLQPPPPPETPPGAGDEEIKAPPLEELTAFVDLARRGYVRSLETRAEKLAEQNPAYAGFARRVARLSKEFKVKELTEWLSSLSPEHAHGSPT
jgi:signal transduction histidine kinase/CheY-like chemotaxis protein